MTFWEGPNGVEGTEKVEDAQRGELVDKTFTNENRNEL